MITLKTADRMVSAKTTRKAIASISPLGTDRLEFQLLMNETLVGDVLIGAIGTDQHFVLIDGVEVRRIARSAVLPTVRLYVDANRLRNKMPKVMTIGIV